jgi:hypothetical protein
MSKEDENIPGWSVTNGERIQIQGTLRFGRGGYDVSIENEGVHMGTLGEVFGAFEGGIDNLPDGARVRLVIEPIAKAPDVYDEIRAVLEVKGRDASYDDAHSRADWRDALLLVTRALTRCVTHGEGDWRALWIAVAALAVRAVQSTDRKAAP